MKSSTRIQALFGATLLSIAALAGCDDDDEVIKNSATSKELQILPQASTIQGRDGGQSGLAWGHSVWTFGDTVLNKNDATGDNWHQNSFSITDDTNAADGISKFFERGDSVGAPRYFISPTADEAAFNAAHRGDECETAPCGARFAAWPGAPIFDASKNRAFVFYSLVYAEPGAFNFKGVGSSVALWERYDQEPVRPEVSADSKHPTLLFGEDEPAWGAGALIQGNVLYTLACDGGGNEHECSLARVPTDKVFDRSAWRYFDGEDDWDEDIDDRKTIFEGAPTVTIARNAYLDKFIAVYARPLSNDVVMREARSLTGPWSDPRLLFRAKGTTNGAYDAALHPEYEEQGGKVMYVTYSRPTQEGAFGSEIALERVELY